MMSKVAIIGSRDFKNKVFLEKTMEELSQRIEIIEIISGGARGADTMGVQWGNRQNIPTTVYYPDFKKRKRAYHFRNRQIVLASDLIVAFWNGYSTGTKYTINYAKALGKKVLIVKF